MRPYHLYVTFFVCVLNSYISWDYSGTPCTVDGELLPPDTPPPPRPSHEKSWKPYKDQLGFEFADLLYRRNEMSQAQMDLLFDLLVAYTKKLNPDAEPPFVNHEDLLATINATPSAMPSWDYFTVCYTGPLLSQPPSWMLQEHTVWYRDAKKTIAAMLKNPNFLGEVQHSPFKEYDSNGKRIYKDLMSGDWAWLQAVQIFSYQIY